MEPPLGDLHSFLSERYQLTAPELSRLLARPIFTAHVFCFLIVPALHKPFVSEPSPQPIFELQIMRALLIVSLVI